MDAHVTTDIDRLNEISEKVWDLWVEVNKMVKSVGKDDSNFTFWVFLTQAADGLRSGANTFDDALDVLKTLEKYERANAA